MIFLFLSVVAICAAGLVGYRWYLNARPAPSQFEFEALVEKVQQMEGRVNKLALAGMGKRAG